MGETILAAKESSALAEKKTTKTTPVLYRQRLILENRIPGRKVARQILSRWGVHLEAEEIDSVVDLALCEAARYFRQGRGTSFLTYSYLYIKGGLARTVAAQVKAHDSLYREPLEAVEHEHSSVNHECANDLSSAIPTAENVVWLSELRELCSRALTLLSGLEREVLVRNCVMEEKMESIACSRGMSRGYLFAVRSSAIKKMRGDLETFKLAA